jgi:hypothetical protein
MQREETYLLRFSYCIVEEHALGSEWKREYVKYQLEQQNNA